MAKQLNSKEIVTFEELLISNMFEMEALIELLNRKGFVRKQEILDMIQELRRKTPQGSSIDQALPEPYLNTETANKLIEQILALMNGAKLTSKQAHVLLDRVRILVEAGEMLARKTTH